jgi:hypothetical protein
LGLALLELGAIGDGSTASDDSGGKSWLKQINIAPPPATDETPNKKTPPPGGSGVSFDRDT